MRNGTENVALPQHVSADAARLGFGTAAPQQRVRLQFGSAAMVMFEVADELSTSESALLPALVATNALLECVNHAAHDETNIPQSTLCDAIAGIQVLALLATAFAHDTRSLLRAQEGNGNG